VASIATLNIKSIDMVKEKELKVNIPNDLTEVNIAQMLVFDKVVKMKVSDHEKMCQLIAAFNGLDIKDVRSIPMDTIEDLGGKILKVLTSGEDYPTKKIVKIKGKEYGIEPDFDKIETGAYIDLETLLRSDDLELHKIMAILYRPIKKKGFGYYKLTEYSTEDETLKKEREALFLKYMPYSIVRQTVNFMQGVMKS